MKTTAEIVKQIRTQKGWTQQEMAYVLDVGRSQVCNIETGRTDLPAQKMLVLFDIAQWTVTPPRRRILVGGSVTNRYHETVLATEAEATLVRDNLLKLLELYGQVSVGDYLDLIGVRSTFVDHQVGWTDLSGTAIVKSVSGFSLKLPDPIPLD